MQITQDHSTPSLFGKEGQLKEVVKVQKVTERHAPNQIDHSPGKHIQRDMITDEPITPKT